MGVTITTDPESLAPAGKFKAGVEAAAKVAAQFADAVDHEARFPGEALAALKAHRLLGVMVPRALGGEQAPLSAVQDICYALGQACASTAMIYAMHQIKVACLVRHMRDNSTLHGMLQRLCTEQLLLASSTTEGHSGGNVRSSEAAIEANADGRIQLHRRASVISYAAYADGIVSTARRSADAAASDQVLVAFLKSDYSLTRVQSWQTLGMRGTCSEGYMLDATGTADQVLPDPYDQIHSRTMVPVAHLLWGAVWSGIATAATARAQAFVRNAMRHGNGQMPPGTSQLTRTIASLRTLRGLLASALRSYEDRMNDDKALAALDFQSMITLTKVEASEMAVSIVMNAARVCGLTGYRSDSEFSVGRHLRDVLSAPLMINNERILTNLATSSLMTPMPTTLRD